MKKIATLVLILVSVSSFAQVRPYLGALIGQSSTISKGATMHWQNNKTSSILGGIDFGIKYKNYSFEINALYSSVKYTSKFQMTDGLGNPIGFKNCRVHYLNIPFLAKYSPLSIKRSYGFNIDLGIQMDKYLGLSEEIINGKNLYDQTRITFKSSVVNLVVGAEAFYKRYYLGFRYLSGLSNTISLANSISVDSKNNSIQFYLKINAIGK